MDEYADSSKHLITECPNCNEFYDCPKFELWTRLPNKDDNYRLVKILYIDDVKVVTCDHKEMPIVIKTPVYIVCENNIIKNLRDELELWKKEANSYKERIREVSENGVNNFKNEIVNLNLTITHLRDEISMLRDTSNNIISVLQNGNKKLIDSERNAVVECNTTKIILEKFQTVLGTLKFKELLECDVASINVNTIGNRDLDLGE